MDQLIGLLSASGGLLVFALAWYAHKKKIRTFACVLAVIGGFMTYAAGDALGAWISQLASIAPIVVVVAVGAGIVTIYADWIRDKKPDKPALVACFIVPVLLVAFFTSLGPVLASVGGGVTDTTTRITEAGR